MLSQKYVETPSRTTSTWCNCKSTDLDANGNVFNIVSSGDTQDVLTIENIRLYHQSCSNCGVNWYEDHVSLDCDECGGYALVRPCPKCIGKCGNVWRRNIKQSHHKSKAVFEGVCSSRIKSLSTSNIAFNYQRTRIS